MKTIEQMWQQYQTALPATAGKIQIQETRRAFYSAIRMFSSSLLSMDENMPDEEAGKIVQGWQDELDQFYAKLMLGLV